MNMNTLTIRSDDYLPLRDVVFNTLRQAIINGEFAPGERLLEISLANRLGVSRTPVREAIRKLELEGLVDMIPRKGAQVARITEKGLRDVAEIRMVLEEYAVGLVCRRIDEDGLARLESLHRQFIDTVNSNDLQEIARHDEMFHDALFQASGNDRLLIMINNLREQFYRYRLEYVKDLTQHSVLVGEHTDLIRAIRTRDEDRARMIMHNHILSLQNVVLEKIRQDESSGLKPETSRHTI